MLSFVCDYLEGAHEAILQRLLETNREQMPGYGSDRYCESAKEKIRRACSCPDAEIFFLVGGTQTNAVAAASMLQSYEGIVAADTGHVSLHEAGAIERTGHKVLQIPQKDGKIQPEELRRFLHSFWQDENHEHMVFPGMVYISHPTEYGTLYTGEELRSLSEICGQYEIPLYLDGARLGYGLAARDTDVTLPLIAECCDLFYIGLTKVGALCGEALVFTKKNMPRHFLSIAKQHGALLAKGRLLGIQFDTMFTDDLYLEISRHAIAMAERLKEGILEKGYSLYVDSPTNQQFVVLKNEQIEKLRRSVAFDFWEKLDEEHTVVRFATSWATSEENVEELLRLLRTDGA